MPHQCSPRGSGTTPRIVEAIATMWLIQLVSCISVPWHSGCSLLSLSSGWSLPSSAEGGGGLRVQYGGRPIPTSTPREEMERQLMKKRDFATLTSIAFFAALTPVAGAQTQQCPAEVGQAQ